MSWPRAPPKGLARLIIAVAATLPAPVNHKSLYRVGAAKTKGCESPVRIHPNITAPKFLVLVPPYLIQFPASSRIEAIRMAGLGPPLCRVYITAGAATTKANRKVVLSQLMMAGVVSKYCADVVDIAEKVSHFLTHQYMISSNSKAWKTYIPADNNVQQDQLDEPKPPPLVDFVCNSITSDFLQSSFASGRSIT